MNLKLLSAQTGPGLVLLAPGGYGKSWWIKKWSQNQTRVLNVSLEDGFSDDYFEALKHQCEQLQLPTPEPNKGAHWAKECLSHPHFWVILDAWDSLEQVERIHTFWQAVLEHHPESLYFILAARKPPQLPLSRFVAQGGQIIERADLRWQQEDCQSIWKESGLTWTSEDQTFLDQAGGWPLALSLYSKFRQGTLSQETFKHLLQEACLDWLPPFVQSYDTLWSPEVQSRLKEWQSAPSNWSDLLNENLKQQSQQSAHFWLWQAISFSEEPSRSKVYLERALSLCRPGQMSLKLNILTREAHNASLSGDWKLHDAALKKAEDWLEEGQSVDQAAWLYLHANRMRQCCAYDLAYADLERLMALNGRHPAVMNFQTRARILKGLTAYQQGDYTLTREAYQQALYLAETDKNVQMQIEVQIMLAFLDALTGSSEDLLPEALYSEVEKLPLSSQPLIWLNLAFYQLLGEHLDLKQGQNILERVRNSAQQLGWTALEPMIADVEARLWRFHKDYARAERLHQQALKALDESTFDWLYASLNHGLTLMRQHKNPEASALLEQIAQRAKTTGTMGIWREAQAALHALNPDSPRAIDLSPPKEQSLWVQGNEALLEIQSFGNFQVRLNGQSIERWPRKRARHLLIHLLMHPHGVHRETMADWLTGSDDLEQALRSLDVHIHSLRKVLEPDRKGKQASRYILFHDACYAFNWNCHYRFDSEIFSQLYQQWLQARESNPAQAEATVNQAIQLYHGTFLPELDFADDWLAERETYARKAADLVNWSLEYLVKQGAYEQAEERSETLLRWDSLSEPGFSWLFKIAGLMQDKIRLQRLGERMEQTYDKELHSPPPTLLIQLYKNTRKNLG